MELTLLILTSILTIPVVVVGAELILAQFPARRFRMSAERPACLVLIPAHNEESGLARTLQNVSAQLVGGDRVLVVADNCTDSTADVAREWGAEVIERHDEIRRGKGFALDCGLHFAANDRREVVVILDADCVLGAGALDRLTRQVAETGLPAQATYRMPPCDGASDRQRVSAFALRVKNQLRPRGLARVGLPCLLTGSGMAFPWDALRSANLATGNIVEDMQLGLDLAIGGKAPLLCADAIVEGDAAPTRSAEAKQRTRWEHGHLRTMRTQVPRLLWAGLKQFRLGPIALALELSVPPLTTLLGLVLAVLTGLIAAWWFGATLVPALVLGVAAGSMFFALGMAWLRFGRADLPAGSLVGLPLYLAWKLPIAVSYLVAPQRKWVRTDRDGATSVAPAGR